MCFQCYRFLYFSMPADFVSLFDYSLVDDRASIFRRKVVGTNPILVRGMPPMSNLDGADAMLGQGGISQENFTSSNVASDASSENGA